MYRNAVSATVALWLPLLSLVLAGCGPAVPPEAVLPPAPVSVSKPLVRNVVDYDSFDGRIKAKETVEVRAKVRGYLVKINFQDGQLVKAKDVLFEIDPKPFQV